MRWWLNFEVKIHWWQVWADYKSVRPMERAMELAKVRTLEPAWESTLEPAWALALERR